MRRELTEAARRGEDLDPDLARHVRVIEYEVPDREGNGKGERFTLVTTITVPQLAPAAVLAQAYHQRWEHEVGHRWHRSSCSGFSRLRSFLAGCLVSRGEARTAVIAGRACPAFAQFS